VSVQVIFEQTLSIGFRSGFLLRRSSISLPVIPCGKPSWTQLWFHYSSIVHIYQAIKILNNQ